MDSDRLKKYRSAVADDALGAQLVTAIAEAEAAGYSIGGEHYKRLPKGYENADEATGKLLRHNALFIDATVPTPEELSSEAFLDFCLAHWKKMSPVHRWLVDNLQTG
jgi:hypothetical protein